MSSSRRTKRGDNQFQQSWLTSYDWIRYKSTTHVTCTICKKDIAFNNMGETAIKGHAKPNKIKPTKHERLAKESKNAQRSLSVLHFRNVTRTSSSTMSSSIASSTSKEQPLSLNPGASTDNSATTSTVQPTLDQYVLPLSVANAEILWAMKVVLSHYSLRSCLGINSLFQVMFLDSEVAKKFSMSKTKCGYYINFGIAPYYQEILITDIKKSPYYSLLFDETLNNIVQEEQMDLYIRYWSEESCMVKSRYFDSQFMRRPNAENISKAIDNSLRSHGVCRDQMINLGMDGPSTNWLVLTLIGESRKEFGLPPVETIGSCGLHIVSGALQTGAEKSGWLIKKVLKAMFNLFNDSPARRDVYIRISSSNIFPERFCPTRWVGNEPVADRAINVWDNVVAVVDYFEKLTVSKRPQNNKSYDTLVSQKNDILMKLKLCVFKDIAHRLNTFLIKFQTDAPMVPFLPDILESMMRDIMGFFITKSALEKAATQSMLLDLDVTVKGNLCLPISDIKLPTASKSMLRNLKLKSGKKDVFLKEYRDFLIGMTVKLQERNPLKYSLVRAASSLNPVKMVNNKEECILLYGSLVDSMFEHNRLTSNEADDVIVQYKDFIETVVLAHSDVFRNFDYNKQRLDTFLYSFLGGNHKYKLFWKVVLFILTLSHGQASIERGFNINKEVLVENLAQESIRCQRLLYDQLKSIEMLHEVPIPRELVISCKNAYQKYKTSLESKKDEAARTESSNKRKLKMDEVVEVKRTKTDVDKVIVTLKKEIDKCCIKASSKDNFEAMKTELEKANLLRETLKKKVVTSNELQTAVNKLEDELSKL